ncbi:unannotated protein [freshwater metagenome]|uniref:Unannotated protein n=1 Tax=freshwater metagenome TaxID=449393 RepID=A0A6J6GDP5_9ZZZZ
MYPPVDVGVPQLRNKAFGMDAFVMTVADVGADATATGIAEVNAPPEVDTEFTAETRNQ